MSNNDTEKKQVENPPKQKETKASEKPIRITEEYKHKEGKK